MSQQVKDFIDESLSLLIRKLHSACLVVLLLLNVASFILLYQLYKISAIIILSTQLMILLSLAYLWFRFVIENKESEPVQSIVSPTVSNTNDFIPCMDNIEDKNIEFAYLINNKQDTTEQYKRLLRLIAGMLNAGSGIAYILTSKKNFTPIAGYALPSDIEVDDFSPGNGLAGQAVINKEILVLVDVPESQIYIESGMGKHLPVSLIFIPVVHKKEVVGMLELQSFSIPDKESIKNICGKITRVFEKNNVALRV